jgi:peptide/nickel transport system ATP-binding protein
MTETAADVVVTVRDLVVATEAGDPILDRVSVELRRGEVLGVLGESGSGKTTLALATLGRTRGGARITGGSVSVLGHDLIAAGPRQSRALRGRLVSYVPQDPGGALNPSRRVGAGIAEVLGVHDGTPGADGVGRALRRVHLPDDDPFQRRFPHQLSGGQQQRVVIGMATAMEPPVVIFDEPTTGLDVVTQAHVLAEIRRLLRETGMSAVYVSHDLAVVAQLTSRVVVMYGGRIVEEGATDVILRTPSHPYTVSLIACTPDHRRATKLKPVRGVPPSVADRPSGCPFRPRCDHASERCLDDPPLEPVEGADHRVACFHRLRSPDLSRAPREGSLENVAAAPVLSVTDVTARYRSRRGDVVAARGVSFTVGRGECVALVGESGSGKTTLGRVIVGLHPPADGTVALHGRPLAPGLSARNRNDRRGIQFIFQNPYDSLNPSRRIGDQIARAAVILRGLSRDAAAREAAAMLDHVRLPARLAERYPSELSGGERQRVAIARALIAQPEVLVCDEVTSALDVSVQAAVVDLLAELQSTLGLGLLFITHDLGVVASIANRVIVLSHGEVCESGPVERVLTSPEHPYTALLLDAAPSLQRAEAHAHAAAVGSGAPDEHTEPA